MGDDTWIGLFMFCANHTHDSDSKYSPFCVARLTLRPDYLPFSQQNGLGYVLTALAPCALDQVPQTI